jgi:PAS domain S-box-containing protein
MSYPFPLKSAQIVSAVDFKLKLYNPDAVNLLRCKRSVVVGASLRNDISCMSNIGFYDRFASVMSSRKDIEFEQRVDHNGEVRWLRVVAKRCQDGIVATMEDISSQKHTESELTQEAKNFQALMESAPDGLSIVEVETGNFMENNAETCRKLGYDRNTMSYLSVYDIDPHAASHREETKAMWRQIVRDNVRTVIFTKQQRKDGSLYDAEVSVAPITYRGRSCIIGAVRDVTERLRSESQMRMMSKALDGAVNLIVITDPNANILYVNPAFWATIPVS